MSTAVSSSIDIVCRPHSVFSRNDWYAVIGIFVITVLIYFSVYNYDIILYDDPFHYQYAKSLSDIPLLERIKHLLIDTVNTNWHPVTTISFYLFDNVLFNFNSGLSHLLNLCIHLANIFLIYLILKKAQLSKTVNTITTFLFAAHPINVETVAWIGERKGLLAAFFLLLTILSYQAKIVSGNYKYYFLSICFFTLGMMSKASIVMFPFFILLSHAIRENKPLHLCNRIMLKVLIIEMIPFLLICTIIGTYIVLIHREQGALGMMDKVDLLHRFNNFINSIRIYISQILIPSNFSIEYPYRTTIPTQELTISYLVVLILLTALLYSYFKSQFTFLCLSWFLAMLIPLSGIIQTGSHPHADRYLYIPAIGIFLFVAQSSASHLMQAKKLLVITCISLAVVIAFSSHATLLRWKNTGTLFEDSIDTAGETIIARINLAAYYFQFNKMEKGFENYEILRKNHPTEHYTYITLSQTLYNDGDFDKAEIIVKDALSIFHTIEHKYPYYKLLARIYVTEKKFRDATSILNLCMSYKSNDHEVYYLIGKNYELQGNIALAQLNYEKSIGISTDYYPAIKAINNLKPH